MKVEPGKKYGRLYVIEFSRKDGWKSYWKCVCDCSPNVIIEREKCQINKALFPSCGCWEKEEFHNKWFNKKIKENKYVFFENYGVFYLSNGDAVYFDLEDYDKIKNFYWLSDGKGYVRSHTGGRKSLHRLLMEFPDLFVDHIDGNPLNNRKDNLRIVTNKKNQENLKKSKTGKSSKYRGVNFNKRAKKWRAFIRNVKTYFLGYFNTEIEAAMAYNKKAEEFGYLTRNIIEEN